MYKTLILTIFAIFFSACSNKEPRVTIEKVPFFSEDKANLYFVNNETSMGMQLHFKYNIKSNELSKDTQVCYGQYSYQALEEDEYTISAVSSEFQLWGKREDHIVYKNYLEKGKIYIIKPFIHTDAKTLGKQLFSVLSFSPDVKIELKEISLEDGLKQISLANEFKAGVGGRRYHVRAEYNVDINDSCLMKYFK